VSGAEQSKRGQDWIDVPYAMIGMRYQYIWIAMAYIDDFL
jgi:hypothetical protein